MSGLTHNVSTQADELLDHIYEYGTNSEGVIHRINQLCDAAVEQLRSELAASREREARMREAGQRLLDAIEHDTQIHRFSILWDGLRAALDEGAQGANHG